ncbi:hypothetical protein GFL49_35410 [Rhizobium leguminosarum bv. viciae]|nr:hypothetical protein [Rhizobium leguminosarum bv. viciae]
MSDPNYHSLDTDNEIGGPVRRSGVGLMRPIAVIAAIAGGRGVSEIYFADEVDENGKRIHAHRE